MLSTLALVALSDTGSVDPVQWLVNYGLAGIVLALLVMGQLRTKPEVVALQQALREALDREKAKDLAMQALMQQIGQTMPQLANAAKLVETIPRNTESDLLRRLEDLTRRIESAEAGGKDA